MSQDLITQKYAPAYVTSTTFYSFIEELAVEGLPHCIDRSLMRRMSGGTQAHLLASLKFLGLVEEDGEVTSQFKALVDARNSGQGAFQDALKDLVDTAYTKLLDGSDIQKLTPRQLAEKFRSAGADGSTLQKAIRFYLRALSECGVNYPKSLNHAVSVTNSKLPKKPKHAEEKSPEIETRKDEKRPGADIKAENGDSGLLKSMLRIPLPTLENMTRAAFVPLDINKADCETLSVIAKAIAERMEASAIHGSSGQ